MKKIEYLVKIGGEWYPCALAEKLSGDRLHFDLYDGSVGVAEPGEWMMRTEPKPSMRKTKRPSAYPN